VCEELRDRFGPITPATKNLIKTSLIQCLFCSGPIKKCEINSSSASFYLTDAPEDLDPKQFIIVLKKALKSFLCPNKINMKNKNTMKISFYTESLEESLAVSQKFGELFSQAFSL
jgi:transcription-repair coupling factor (superfamily II helicase)